MPRRQILVPLVVVALALAVWRWPGGGGPVVELADDVEACSANLRVIHAGLVEYERRFGHAPEEGGAHFLTALLASGVWADTPENRARLACPGTGAGPVYAARDVARFPLAKFPSGGAELEPIAACDNARGLNHAGCMNLLRSDGSVVVLELERLRAAGTLPSEARTIPVGPASPVPELAKLASP